MENKNHWLNSFLYDPDRNDYSKNELAEKIVGKRIVQGIIFDQPCELDYHCPICEYENVVDGNFDERLHWSEYNGFLWCEICNRDYPSALCEPNIDKAINTFLSCVYQGKKHWNDALKNPPKESNRYWVYVEVQGDLGLSYYQDNAYYNINNKTWTSEILEKEGGKVTHWTELMSEPEN